MVQRRYSNSGAQRPPLAHTEHLEDPPDTVTGDPPDGCETPPAGGCGTEGPDEPEVPPSPRGTRSLSPARSRPLPGLLAPRPGIEEAATSMRPPARPTVAMMILAVHRRSKCSPRSRSRPAVRGFQAMKESLGHQHWIFV